MVGIKMMTCPDYKTPDIGNVCRYYMPNGFCKHPRHFECLEIFNDSFHSSRTSPPCPLDQSTTKNEFKACIWSRRGQGGRGGTLTTFTLISLKNIVVVKVVKAKSHISHMRERIYYCIHYFLFSFFSRNFDFVKKYPDHLDHTRNHSAFTLTNRLDQP
jgi:hypothetical protein